MGKSNKTRTTPKRRETMPVYWRQNIATNATKRVLKLADSKKRTELDRFAIGQVVSYCSVIAASDILNMKRDELERLTAEMNARAGVYIMERQHRGQIFARNSLAERTDRFFADPFVLPAGKMPKKDCERRRLADRRDAADMVMRYYVEALDKLSCTATQITAAVQETKRNYSQFLEWAKDGEDVAYEMLRRIIEQTIGGKVYVVDTEEKPIFENL